MSGLDPVIVFVRVRFFWGVLGVISLYALLRAIFESRPLARFSTLLILAMVLSGRAPAGSESFARLVPLSGARRFQPGLLFR